MGLKISTMVVVLLVAVTVAIASEIEFKVVGTNIGKYTIGEKIEDGFEIELRTGEYLVLHNAEDDASNRIEGPYVGLISDYDSSKQSTFMGILNRVFKDPEGKCGTKGANTRGEDCDKLEKEKL